MTAMATRIGLTHMKWVRNSLTWSECVRARAHAHTQRCVPKCSWTQFITKIPLLLLVVSFKIDPFEIYITGLVFLLLIVTAETDWNCVGRSVIAPELWGHPENNSLKLQMHSQNQEITQSTSTKYRRWGTTAIFSPTCSWYLIQHLSLFGCGDDIPFQWQKYLFWFLGYNSKPQFFLPHFWYTLHQWTRRECKFSSFFETSHQKIAHHI